MTVNVGDVAYHSFTLDEEAMRLFRELCGDNHPLHSNMAYAKARGYDGIIGYGGILLAKVCYVLAQNIPGTNGVSLQYTIKFPQPMYVGESAEIRLEVTDVSKATCIVHCKFVIRVGTKTVATGTTQSIVPLEEIGE